MQTENTFRAGIAAVVLIAGCFLGGCGAKAPQEAEAVRVKAMRVLQQDTPLHPEYAGQIKGREEIQIRPKVSGVIVEKHIKSGQQVTKGQLLYKIDSRQYESEVLSARASLQEAEANLNNQKTDLARYEKLAQSGAISQQMLATQRANVQSYQGARNNLAALLKKAEENLEDTLIKAPVSGKISVDDVSAGTYATAGVTNLVTMGGVDPIYVQFSVSENEYLNYMTELDASREKAKGLQASLLLSNGKRYPLTTDTLILDRALSSSTGTLSVKALFPNPDGVLLPGMFGCVRLSGRIRRNAVLVPQRAVQQLLDKSFVILCGPEDKSVSRVVALGELAGSYYIVEKGLSAGDTVVVEGLTGLTEGRKLDVTMVTPEEMRFFVDTNEE